MAASADDAYETESTGATNITASTVRVTSSTSARVWGGLRFTGPGTLPPMGAVIDVATLSVFVPTGGTDDANMDIYAEDAASPAAFTTGTGNITGRTRTTASAAWVQDDIGINAWAACPTSLVPLIQELVDRTDYTPTAIVLILKPKSDITKACWPTSRDGSASLCAKLHLVYHMPTETLTKVGSFTKPAAAGSQAITGVGFKPKLLLLFATAQTVAGNFDPNSHWGFGASGLLGETISYYAMAGWSKDAFGGNDTDRYTAEKALALWEMTSSPQINEANLSSFDADGFTLNWTDVDQSTEWIIHYLAIGGDNVEAKVSYFNPNNGSTGEQTYSHVGFQPDALLLFGAPDNIDTLDPLPYPGYQHQSFGMVDSAGNQFATCGSSIWDYNVPPTVSARYQVADKCFVSIPTNPEAPDHVESAAHWTGMTSNGFKLYWDTASPGGYQRIISVAIKGLSARVGTTIGKGSAGDVAVTGAGFQPRGAFFAGFNYSANANIQNSNRFSIGAADTAKNLRSIASFDTNGSTPNSVTDQANFSDAAYIGADGHPPMSFANYGMVTAWGSDGFTMTWYSAVTYSTDQVGYLLLGDAVATLAVAASSGVASMAGVTVSTATPATIVAAATSGVASFSNVIVQSLSILAAAAMNGVASLSNVAMTAASILAVAAVSGIASLPAVIVRSLSILAAAASGGVASVSNTLVGSLSILSAGATSGVATLPAVIVRSLSILAVAATSGVASVANVIISPILVAAAMNGLASLSGVAVAAPATVVAAAVSGVASLPNVIVKSLSILAAGAASGIASLSNVAMTAASILAVAATSGVASLSNVTVRSLSILAVAAVSGVASVSNTLVGSLSILSAAATSGAASVSNVSLKAAAILAAASTSGVATAANVLLRAAAILSVVSVSGVASVPNTKVATRITLSVAATTGRASLPNVVLSSGSVVPAILTVAPSSGVATIPNIKVASLVRLTVATTSGVASLSNVTVRSLSILGVASMSGVASVSNVTVSAVFSPLTVAATNGTASMSNVAVTAPARLAIDATSGSASLPNVTVSAATVGELNLASMNGAASVANVSIQATAILGVASVSGVASIDNVILCSLSILAVGSTAGLASFPEVTITTGVTPLVVAATSGAASLSNLTVSSPSIFTIAPTSGVASVAGVEIVTGVTLLVGTVNGAASVANVSVSAAAILAIGPSSGVAAMPNVTVLAVTPGTLTVAAMSGIASLAHITFGYAATVIDLIGSFEFTTDLSGSYEPTINLEASYE